MFCLMLLSYFIVKYVEIYLVRRMLKDTRITPCTIYDLHLEYLYYFQGSHSWPRLVRCDAAGSKITKRSREFYIWLLFFFKSKALVSNHRPCKTRWNSFSWPSFCAKAGLKPFRLKSFVYQNKVDFQRFQGFQGIHLLQHFMTEEPDLFIQCQHHKLAARFQTPQNTDLDESCQLKSPWTTTSICTKPTYGTRSSKGNFPVPSAQ